MSAVWPDSLDYARRFRVIKTNFKKKLAAGFGRIMTFYWIHTFRIPSSMTNLPADNVAPPAKKLEC